MYVIRPFLSSYSFYPGTFTSPSIVRAPPLRSHTRPRVPRCSVPSNTASLCCIRVCTTTDALLSFPQKRFLLTPFNGERHIVLALLQIPSCDLTAGVGKSSRHVRSGTKRRTSSCWLPAHPRLLNILSFDLSPQPMKYVIHKMINTDFISPHVIISRSRRLVELALLVLVRV